MRRGWPKLLLIAIGAMVLALIIEVKSNPLSYCGYCQHERMEKWKAGNAYPCSFWRYLFTSNSADFTLYLNTPGG
jgi:hypothetical protein